MNRWKNYIIPAFYHIRHNLSFAIFYVLGTALAFVFIAIVLQLVYSVVGNEPPMVNADRIVCVDEFRDGQGCLLDKIPAEETASFMESIRGCELCAISHTEVMDVFGEYTFETNSVDFVNADYWHVFRFEFVEGRAFLREEFENKQPVAVISESMADMLFKGESPVGKKIECQKVVYTITGVVKDVSVFTTGISGKVWLSDKYNTFAPSGSRYHEIYVLFPDGVSVSTAKQEIVRVVKDYYARRGEIAIISAETLYTMKESQVHQIGVQLLLYGVPVALLILLFVPSINIMTLSVANSDKQSEEIAIRRAIGASRRALFFQIMIENLMLVVIGVFLGLLLLFPVVHVIEEVCIKEVIGGMEFLVTRINFGVILGCILPLMLVFTLLTGGFSAYVAVKKNLAEVLKGGIK